MNILLTGGAGYIGSHVALSLIDKGNKVHIIDNLSTGNIKLIPKNASFTNCNINDEKQIAQIVKTNNFDILMHFAGYIQVEESVENPDKYFENNTNNSITLFQICKNNNLNNIIFSSTAAAYGALNTDNLINENCILNPQNPYAESKIKTENYLINNINEFNYIILRYFNVAGADTKMRAGQMSKQSTHLIKILSEVIVGKKDLIEIFGNDYSTNDGTAIRDYIHVSDLANIHIETAKYLLNNKESNIFNCGYGRGYSVQEVIDCAKKLYKNKINFKYSKRRMGDVEKLIAETSKIKNHLNWKPEFDSLEIILKSSVDWERKLNEKNS